MSVSKSASVSTSVSTSVARRVQPISRIFNRRKEAQQEAKPETGEETAAEEEANVQEEKPRKVEPRLTQRKRFRLIKTPSRNRGSLVEKLLQNIDKQNEVETSGPGTGGRRIRFRPSVRRENIRRKVQAAVGTEDTSPATERPRPRFRVTEKVGSQCGKLHICSG